MKYGYTDDELRLIWIDGFTDIDYAAKRKIADITEEFFPTKDNLISHKAEVIAAVGEKVYERLYNAADNAYLLKLLGEYGKAGVTVLTVKSDAFPESLWETDDCPLAIYCKGDISLLSGRLFGIVGSRKNIPD